MKTLKNHVIVYDAECPLCDLYTSAFVHTKMLDDHGRQQFNTVPAEMKSIIDMDRARDEIALVNTRLKTVDYGVDSLVRILSYRFPLVEKVTRLPFIQWFLKRLYLLISFNRRVIVPAGSTTVGSCLPSFNKPYRIAYIVIAWCLASLVLFHYAGLFGKYFVQGSYWREFIVCGGQIPFQLAWIRKLTFEDKINYVGNLLTVSLLGAIMLLPALMLAQTGWIEVPECYLVYFFMTVTVMLLEHRRRVKLIHLPATLSSSWILYRMLVLIFMLYLLKS